MFLLNSIFFTPNRRCPSVRLSTHDICWLYNFTWRPSVRVTIYDVFLFSFLGLILHKDLSLIEDFLPSFFIFYFSHIIPHVSTHSLWYLSQSHLLSYLSQSHLLSYLSHSHLLSYLSHSHLLSYLSQSHLPSYLSFPFKHCAIEICNLE